MSKIRYFLDNKLAIATIMKSDLDIANAKQEETEGFIDFIMGIDTVEVGICILEVGKNKYKISFRSKEADVNAVASTFGGGGHVLASGSWVLVRRVSRSSFCARALWLPADWQVLSMPFLRRMTKATAV